MVDSTTKFLVDFFDFCNFEVEVFFHVFQRRVIKPAHRIDHFAFFVDFTAQFLSVHRLSYYDGWFVKRPLINVSFEEVTINFDLAFERFIRFCLPILFVFQARLREVEVLFDEDKPDEAAIPRADATCRYRDAAVVIKP